MNALQASSGDTTVVQTFSFSDARGTKMRKFLFPNDASKQYEKILMLYSAKCKTTGSTAACGEWDYDQATELLIPAGTDINGDTIYDVWRLGVFITPYGNNLTMTEGWSWTWDVSDFVHLLKDSVIIRDYNSQQSVDIKFLFIEGTPPRDVISLRKIWDGTKVSFPNYWQGYPLSKFDSIVRDTTIVLLPEEKQVKLLSTITGHMMDGGNAAAEFSNNTHSVKANGQVIQSFQIIQKCSNNPMYPQGGTWMYARAGWCTGAPGKVREFELSPYIINNSINFDYDVQYDPNGVYRTDIKLVTYGDINHPIDVTMVDIITPSTNFQHKRYNPSLGSPVIKIKNIGANNLTSLTIIYSFDNHSYTHQWTGNLPFMQEETVTLPRVNYDEIGGSEATGTFSVELRNPNGVTDPTPYNNKLSSQYKLPPIYNVHDFRIVFKPDPFPTETKWFVRSVNGDVLIAQSQTGMVYNTTYNTDITLTNGGFYVELTDDNEDGMYPWPRNPNGTAGAASLRRAGTGSNYIVCKNFTAWFGDAERFYFGVNQFSGIREQSFNLVNLSVYPNPAQTELNLDLTQLTSNHATATIYDMIGRVIATQEIIAGQINTLNISDLKSGIHFVSVSDNGRNIWRSKFIKM